MKRCILLLALGVMLLFASNANASLAPDLPPAGYPVAGEADLTYTIGGTTYHVYVDWIVDYLDDADWDDGGPVYIYLYQVENTLPGSGDIIDEFSIQPIAGNIIEHGWAKAEEGITVDLDSGLGLLDDFDYNHVVGNFANLSGEHEDDAAIETVESSQLIDGIGGRKMEWSFDGGTDGVPSGDESDTLWFVSSSPPVYAPGYADNTIKLSGKVPAPMPEPSSMLLLGMGLVGFAGGAIRKRFKA